MPLRPPPEGLQPIRSVRVNRRITQKELGKIASIDQSTMSRLEGGLMIPTRIQLARICRALKASPEELFTEGVILEVERRAKIERAS